MEILSSPYSRSLKWCQRRSSRSPARFYSGATTRRRMKMKTVRLGGGGSPQRGWRIKAAAPKLKAVLFMSPVKVLRKLKNLYLSMMLNLGHKGTNAFGEKRIPKARHVPIAYSATEFDNRLVSEIYKSLVASHELATN